MLSDAFSGNSQEPVPTDPLPMSSQFMSTQLTQDDAPVARKQNPVSLNLLRDDVQKVMDTTAVEVQRAFERFLEEFCEVRSDGSVFPFYVEQIKELQDNERTTLFVDLQHVFENNSMLAEIIQSQYYRMEPYLKKAVQNLVRKYSPDYIHIRTGKFAGEEGVMREFWVSWYNAERDLKRLRQLRTVHIGQLVCISGTVTRTSEVRPELVYGTFQCRDCMSIIKDVEQEFKYTEPTTCLNTTCNNRRSFTLLTEKSKFVDWQKIRIQENADEVPTGAMPRSMDVIVRNEMVERAKAGDRVMIAGSPIVIPDVATLYGNNAQIMREAAGRSRDGYGNEGITGLKALGARDLSYKLMFLGCFVKQAQEKTTLNALHDLHADVRNAADIESQFTEEELEMLEEMRQDKHLYHKLVSSVAPHIFGEFLSFIFL